MKKRKILLKIFVFCAILSMPLISLAASGSGSNTSVTFDNPLGSNTTIVGLITKLINNILMPIGSVVAVVMIMYAGFMYVTARGDSGKIKDARNALQWAVVGAAILLGAWVISQAISGTVEQIQNS